MFEIEVDAMTLHETEKNPVSPDSHETKPSNFIRDIIDADLKTGKHHGRVATRFPPEPNGYLHIGHSKSICLNFGIARDYKGACNLRFDDTNPFKENIEYVNSIMEDVRGLGLDWGVGLYYASAYYQKLYELAIELIKKGKAYVCDLNADQIREYRGTLTKPGRESPFRNRSVEENLKLFERMKNGEFDEGHCVLRAKIDMSSPNITLRDPVIYRILKTAHHRTCDKWCIYPMYDYAHPISDALEGITHSICTLEFEDHRPLYDWCLEYLDLPSKPQQIEFARLNLNYTVMSKRKLLDLVKQNLVRGWDDPRMPTIAGLRRRGFTPESIRDFCDRIGVARANSIVDVSLLEHCLREDLNKRAKRVMGVIRPLKVVIENYPEGQVEEVEALNNPEDPSAGTRKIPFSKVLFIEHDDFREVPPKGYYRLSPGKEVRLKYAYYITCQKVVKDEKTGEIREVHCTYDPATKGGRSDDGRKVKGTSHWVSTEHSIRAEVRLYENLFTEPNPGDLEGDEYKASINPKSLEIVPDCPLEPSLKEAVPGTRFQFERTGYFTVDPDSRAGAMVFNRTVPLRDTWAKIEKGQK